jgi:hypothetical protein
LLEEISLCLRVSVAETPGMESARTLTSSSTYTMVVRGFQYVENAGVKFAMGISSGVSVNAQKVVGRGRRE